MQINLREHSAAIIRTKNCRFQIHQRLNVLIKIEWLKLATVIEFGDEWNKKAASIATTNNELNAGLRIETMNNYSIFQIYIDANKN